MKHVLFPREPLEAVVNGWSNAFYTGESYCGFINIIDEVKNPWEAARIELAAIPITQANLDFAAEKITDGARVNQLRKYNQSLWDKNADEWVFQFALVANLGGFGTEPQDILTQFNMLCAMYRYCMYIDQLALRRLARMKDEVTLLTKDVFRPEQSPGQNPIIPPLSKEDIIWLNKKALALQADRESRYLIQTELDLLKLLRYIDCINGQIRGYSVCSREAVSHLVTQSFVPFHIKSPYIIHKYFRFLCYYGLSYSALGFYLEYQGILDRPKYLLDTNNIMTYIKGCSATRLIDGLRLALNRGHVSVLEAFLLENEIRPRLDNLPFFASLVQGLNKRGFDLACEVYHRCGGNYAKVPWLHPTWFATNTPATPEKEILEEEALIGRVQSGHYYDDPGFFHNC